MRTELLNATVYKNIDLVGHTQHFSGYVLFLGNNDESTDHIVSDLARQHDVQNYGLITDPAFSPDRLGYYHTTVVDIPWGELTQLGLKFDSIIMLDQPQDQWSHWKCMQATCKVMTRLEELGKHTVFRQNANIQKILYWIDLVYNKNQSMCIYPWINLNNDGENLKLCSRDRGAVTTIDQLKDWKNNPDYNRIRQSMLDGHRLPEHCRICYEYEDRGMESYRQFETIDWITQLDIENIDALSNIDHPYFYEVHTGNHCNIKCRGCQPSFSEPIGRELKKFKISTPTPVEWNPSFYSIDRIDIDSLDKKSSVYFQGGEPTIMPEVREFMQKCIAKNRTDFFLTFCTNGVNISQEFVDLISHFTNINFSFSLDGYGAVNDYWRWGSRWDRVISNAHRMRSLGHSVSINTVPGIYNVTNMHLLFEFLDREFPFAAIYMQVNYLPWQSCYNHPLKELVIESMLRCQQTSIYHSNGKSCKTSIDSIYNHYINDPICDMEQLKNFFDYNDQLDRARKSKLADYIPELEQARSYIR
jgi:sulfatase maturation enzyme AslB (radical SAM superfamily)